MSGRARLARAGGVALLAAMAVGVAAPGCKKTKESLIVVQLSLAREPTSAIVSVTLVGGGRDETYEIDTISTDKESPTQLGLYVDKTGKVHVEATARPGAGECNGFVGSGSATINSAGETKYVAISLMPSDVCGTTGAGGHAGGSGQGGQGGSPAPVCLGTAPPPGVPPSLTCCTTYDHGEPSTTGTDCDDNFTYIYTAAFSPDGTLALTGGDDGRVVFWTYDGQRLALEGHYLSNSDFGYAAFSPDGSLVAIGGPQVVDVYYLTGTKAWTRATSLAIDGRVYGIGFTPDSKQVITLDSGANLYVHSLTQAAPLYRAVAPVITPYGLAVAPAAVGGVLGVAVIDEDGMTAVFGVTSQGLGSPTKIDTGSASAWAGCFSPDGTMFALGESTSYARFHSFPVTSTASVGTDITIGSDDDVRACAFSPNGSYIALVGGWLQGSASIWNVSTRAVTSRYNFLDSRINGLSVAFAPAGNAILVGGQGCGKVLLCRE